MTLFARFRCHALEIAEEAGLVVPVGFEENPPSAAGTWPRTRARRYSLIGGEPLAEVDASGLAELMWTHSVVRASFVRGCVADLEVAVLLGTSASPVAEFVRTTFLHRIDEDIEGPSSEPLVEAAVADIQSWARSRGVEPRSCPQVWGLLRVRLLAAPAKMSVAVPPSEGNIEWRPLGASEGVLGLVGTSGRAAIRFTDPLAAAALQLAIALVSR